VTRLIVVDATPYGPEPSGARRRTEELLARLPALLPDDVFEVHWPADGAQPPDTLQADNLVHAVVETSCRGGVRRWFRRGRALRRRHADAPFTHLLSDYGPVVKPRAVHNIVTLHDLRFLHGHAGRLRGWYGRYVYGRGLRKAAAVVAVSEAVRTEAQRYYGCAVDVVPNAVSAAFAPSNGRTRAGALVVARDEPRKARGAAVWAAKEAGLELCIVDGGLDEAALRDAYQRSQWLLAPSIEEGFHFPVVEALACGTPVIASDIPAHRELALGAQGLVIVAKPTRQGSDWSWSEAVEALRDGAPVEVAPPELGDWDVQAGALAAMIERLDPIR